MRRITQLDVFASGPCTGNPLAVVLDAEALWIGGAVRTTVRGTVDL